MLPHYHPGVGSCPGQDPGKAMRNFIVWIVLSVLGSASCQGDDIRPFLQKHCADCHDSDSAKGGFDLTALPEGMDAEPVRHRWVQIHDRVRLGEMPPPERAQPEPAEKERFLGTLGEAIEESELRIRTTTGRSPMRRLTRTEYENTLRDLFQMPGLGIADLLPEDGRTDGFAKAGASLEISAEQLSRYMEISDRVLDRAMVGQQKPYAWSGRFRLIGGFHLFGTATFPIQDGRVDLQLVRQINRTLHTEDQRPVIARMDALGIITHARTDFIPGVENFMAHLDGYYRIQTRLYSFTLGAQGKLEPADRPQWISVRADGRHLTWLDAPSLEPVDHDVLVWLNAGERLEMNPASLWPTFQHVLHPTTVALAASMARPGIQHPFHYRGPGVAVAHVDIKGPIAESWPPLSHRAVFGDLPLGPLPKTPPAKPLRRVGPPPRADGMQPGLGDNPDLRGQLPRLTAQSTNPPADLDRLTRSFVRRAFRRPVSEVEVGPYIALGLSRLESGELLEAAMRTVCRAVLSSPDFLHLRETARPSTNSPLQRLDGHALASRLSYLLWSSMPDERLMDLADQGDLTEAMLRTEGMRLLADPRSSRFIADFLDQWLGLRDIDFTTPDPALYPEFRADLRDAMLEETRSYFRQLLDEDLGVRHFVDSDFLMLNQRMAEHYEIEGVEGSRFRKVPRPKGSVRGGFLTQASILKITANGTTTSPVKRGVWVLDRLLGTPPRPPPPNTPAVDPDVRGTTTIRDQLDRHRDNASCATCHKAIDPPGLALECFDVIGGLRTRYRFIGSRIGSPEQRRGQDPDLARFPGIQPFHWAELVNTVRQGPPVDPTAVLADGTRFRDLGDCKSWLLRQEMEIARAFVRRLILYATGTPVGFADREEVEAILERCKPHGLGVRSLLMEVINSPLFTAK